VAVVPATGGAFLHSFDVLPQVSGKLRFTPDGQALTYAVTDGRGVGNLWVQALTGGTPTQVTDFKSDQIFDFAWSHDGKQLAVSRGKTDRDVVLLTDTSR
jgi:Tol biopolymer transport system component